MTVHYNQKGKFFTQVVSKEPIPTIIQTLTHCIHGNIHVRLSERFSDEINACNHFIAVTNATVFDDHGEVLYKTNFIAVNQDRVVWLLPQHEILEDK
ncbi:MAG: hypothetical protein AB1345_10565 [Chloroflexota bacterium]